MQTMTASITDRPSRSQGSRLLRAQFEVASALASSHRICDAGPAVLATICSHVGWVLAELWRVDAGGQWLRCQSRWAEASIEAMVCRFPDVTFALGRGLPGVVWERGAPLWSADLRAAPELDHHGLSARADIRTAHAVPVTSGDRMLGVLTLFGYDFGPPGEDLRCWLEAISTELAIFVTRQEAEEERVRLREALVERERLAAIGRTAASLGHEIANPLSGMLMSGQLMQRRLEALPDPDPKLAANLDRLVSETRRLVALLEDFRSLWRRQSG